MSKTFTDRRGIITDSSGNEIIGKWFISHGRVGFFTTRQDLKEFIDSLQEDGIRTQQNEFNKGSIHSLPFSVIRHTFAAVGYHLLDEEQIDEADNSKALPGIERSDKADTYFLGNKFYVFDSRTDKSVGLLRVLDTGPKLVDSVDKDLDTLFKRMELKGIQRNIPDVRVDNFETRTMVPINEATLQDIQEVLTPDYYLMPAGYEEGE